MITIKTLDKEYTFPDNDSAISFIKENNLLNYSIQNEKEIYVFVGGKLLYCDNPWFYKVGNFAATKA